MILIYDKPMVWYPIQTLIKAGIKEIAIVLSENTAGQIISYVKDGKDFGLDKVSYVFQEKAGGIAEAIALTEDFADQDDILVILGDNTTNADLSEKVEEFKYNLSCVAKVFLQKVEDPSRFGVPTFGPTDAGQAITKITEKPESPDSDYAITGLYFYDNNVFNYIRKLKPSSRGELEVSDLNNMYIKNGRLLWSKLDGFWCDAGTFDSLFKANEFWFNEKSGS